MTPNSVEGPRDDMKAGAWGVPDHGSLFVLRMLAITHTMTFYCRHPISKWWNLLPRMENKAKHLATRDPSCFFEAVCFHEADTPRLWDPVFFPVSLMKQELLSVFGYDRLHSVTVVIGLRGWLAGIHLSFSEKHKQRHVYGYKNLPVSSLNHCNNFPWLENMGTAT